MSGDKGKAFWRGFWDGFSSPFSFFLTARAEENMKRASVSAEENLSKIDDQEAYARRQYQIFVASIGAENIAPSYDADSPYEALCKGYRGFLKTAAEEAKHFTK